MMVVTRQYAVNYSRSTSPTCQAAVQYMVKAAYTCCLQTLRAQACIMINAWHPCIAQLCHEQGPDAALCLWTGRHLGEKPEGQDDCNFLVDQVHPLQLQQVTCYSCTLCSQ
jgi:hypothetical protein